MMGQRELNRTILELGNRIDGLGGLQDIPLDPSYEDLQQAAESAAHSLIENVGGGLLQELPIVVDETDDEIENESSGSEGLSDLLPGLLNKLLDSTEENEDTHNGGSTSE